ncbi:MAG: type II secretion system protein [Elusimicrobia bacterium]|nr:type II secretion system protein [Elusimicrobiota bacterium]
MKRNKGLTLIELIIAIVIFASITLASVAYFGGSRKQAVKAKNMNFALQLAENQLESFKSMEYDRVRGSSPATYRKYGTTFHRYYAASELNTFDEVYKVIQVSVTWRADGADERVIRLFTIISPKDN